MPVLRVYLALTAADLAALAQTGELSRRPLAARSARTPGAFADVEELEHAAWLAAAADARAADPTGRRVLASVDVDAAAVHPAGGDSSASSVLLDGPLARRRIASFHVDEEPGGSDADLLWYDATELDAVARLATGD